MKQRAQISKAAKAKAWARRLTMRVGKVLAAHPHADPDNVRHTLILLERQKLKVLSLERILASKLAASRAKDRLTVPVLRDALAATQTLRRRAKMK